VQNGVRFEVEDDEDSDSQHEIEREEGTRARFSSPQENLVGQDRGVTSLKLFLDGMRQPLRQ